MIDDRETPVLRSFAELLTWRLSSQGTRWLAEKASENPAGYAVLGAALGLPLRGGRQVAWNVNEQGLALLIFVEEKLGRNTIHPIKPSNSAPSPEAGRYVTVPTAQGPRRVAVDIIGVHETPADPPEPRPSIHPGDRWRIESSDGTFGTVAAYFLVKRSRARVRVLTAAHVVADDRETLDVGGQLDAGQVLATQFSLPARRRWPDLAMAFKKSGGGDVAWKVDAAWLTLRDHAIAALFPQGVDKLPVPPEMRPLVDHLGRDVEMTGQATGRQVGRVYGVAFEWTSPALADPNGLPRQFADLLIGARGGMDAAASEPGDSGKGVVDRTTGETIGVVWDGFYRRLSGFPSTGWAFATAADFAIQTLEGPPVQPPASGT